MGKDIFLLFITQAVRIFETSKYTQLTCFHFDIWVLKFEQIECCLPYSIVFKEG